MTKNNKDTRQMCEHKKLTFLGKQEIPSDTSYLALFNCDDCRSTISLKMVKPSERKKGRLARSA